MASHNFLIKRDRFFRRSIWSGALLIAAVHCSRASNHWQNPPPPVASTPQASVSTVAMREPVARMARWVPLASPPADWFATGAYTLRDGRRLRVDVSGMRWLGLGEQWEHAVTFLEANVRAISQRPQQGLVFIGRNGIVEQTEDILGPVTFKAQLDCSCWECSPGDCAHTFRGGVTLGRDRLKKQDYERFSTDLRELKPLLRYEGNAGLRVAIGEDGEGLALFEGGKVALTRDSGATWKEMSTAGVTVHTMCQSFSPDTLLIMGAKDTPLFRWKPGMNSLEPLAGGCSIGSCSEPLNCWQKVSRFGLSEKLEQLANAQISSKNIELGRPPRVDRSNAVTDSLQDRIVQAHVVRASTGAKLILGEGAIGGDMAFEVYPLPQHHNWPKDPVVVACNGTDVVGLGKYVWVHKSGQSHLIESPGEVVGIAPYGENSFALTIRSSIQSQGGKLSPASNRLYIFASDFPPKLIESDLPSFEDLESVPVGSCFHKHLWVFGEKIYPILKTQGTSPRVFTPASVTIPVGVDASGTLVLWRHLNRTLYYVTPEGEQTAVLPNALLLWHDRFQLIGDKLMMTAHSNSTRPNEAYQSDNAGRNWYSVGEVPGCAQERSSICYYTTRWLCGVSRCELPDHVVRLGWEMPDEEHRTDTYDIREKP